MRRYKLEIKGKDYVVDVQELAAARFRVILGDQALEVQISSAEDLAQTCITPEIIPIREGDEAVVERPATSYRPADPATLGHTLQAPSPALPTHPHLPSDGLRSEITAPMPGVIHSVEVNIGDEVKHGQTLVILEAMKMKNSIRSPRDGVISEILVRIGQTVGYGVVLVKFEEGKP
jgi:glutaconyl-CoA/methylmalonyl-CoA decarboxylase subunit gamma